MFQQVLGQWVLYPDYFSLLSSLYCTFAQIKTGTNKLLKKHLQNTKLLISMCKFFGKIHQFHCLLVSVY